MEENEEIAYIQRQLGQSEILCQLAEEASELAQAALKLRRALDGTNPTPKSRYECISNLNEEIADVWVCLAAYDGDCMDAYDIVETKLHRWAERLRERESAK